MEGEWRDVILVTIRENPSKRSDKPDEGYGTWIVARVKPDNKLFGVTFRSGRYYPNKVTGEKTLPKDGIGFYDFMELKKPWKGGPETTWEMVVKMLDPKHPPVLPHPSEQAKTPAPPEPKSERMPWE